MYKNPEVVKIIKLNRYQFENMLECVHEQHDRNTRWGTITRYIYKNVDDTYWAFYIETGSGDSDYMTFDDFDDGGDDPEAEGIEGVEVVPVETTTVVWTPKVLDKPTPPR